MFFWYNFFCFCFNATTAYFSIVFIKHCCILLFICEFWSFSEVGDTRTRYETWQLTRVEKVCDPLTCEKQRFSCWAILGNNAKNSFFFFTSFLFANKTLLCSGEMPKNEVLERSFAIEIWVTTGFFQLRNSQKFTKTRRQTVCFSSRITRTPFPLQIPPGMMFPAFRFHYTSATGRLSSSMYTNKYWFHFGEHDQQPHTHL